jgi:hypothetical protein
MFTTKVIIVLGAVINAETEFLRHSNLRRQSDQKRIPSFTSDIRLAREFESITEAEDFIDEVVCPSRKLFVIQQRVQLNRKQIIIGIAENQTNA